MCGLAGTLLAPIHRSPARLQVIRDAFTANLLANEERGREAAGVTLIRDDGDFILHKSEGPVSDLVNSREYQRILAAIDQRAVCLLGHTRAPTKGRVSNNLNNHPIVVGNIIGIHNGHIDNDDQLFTHFHFPRRGQVDSEVIFQLLDCLEPHLLHKAYLQHMANVIGVLDGPVSVLAVDLRYPARLLVIKNRAPLCMHYEPKWGTLLFSSRYIFLRKAFGRQVATEKLPTSHVMGFDANKIPNVEQCSLATLRSHSF